MGQLWTLVWKNFCWCLRHPIITVIFFVIPSLAAYGTWYVMPEEIAHNEQCSYPALALFPSPANSLFGALCCFTSLYDNKVSCMTEMWQPGIFVQPHEFVNNWTDSAGNFHCPGSNTDQHEFQTSQSDADYLIGAIRQSCSKRSIYIWDISRVYQFSVLDFLFHGMILYYPTNEQTRNFTNKMVDALNHLGHQAQKLAAKVTTGNQKSGNFCITDAGERTVGFSSKSEALDYALARNLTDQIVWGIIEFKSMSHDFRYKLITHTGMRYETSTLYLQSLIESTAVEYLSGQKWVDNIDSKLLPERCRKRPQQYEMAFFVSGALMTFCLFAVAYVITSEISAEKAAGLTELLFIAGVPRWKVKLSWTIFGAAFMLTICLGIGIFLKFGLAHLVENTDFSLLMVLMALHATSLISVCLFFASFMPSGEKAGALMIVSILIAYYVPNWTNLLPDVGYDKNIALARVLSLIHPTISIQIGIGYVFAFEKEGIGLSWMALADSPSAFDKFYGMLEIFIDLLAQIIVYSILSWYFDQTAPSRYGLKQPWLFPFYPSYWRPKPTENSPPKIDAPDAEKVEDFAKQRRSSMMRITHDGTVVGDTEESDGVLKAGIKICGLTKSYGKNKVAVNDLTVAFYENEITAFLGHNGAGKSTTINMLTGMTTPTTGTALLGGKDIWTHMNKIRRSLGFCPQYDMIYPNLTVREHMRFYGALKGFSKANVDAYSDKILAQLQMNSSQTLKTIAKKLSGGMKRKLCIALAFLGDPDIVVLDEPTSAIDPFSRRAIWDVILRHRSKSTILLSTHNMEEADILGDRIAIIDHGKLKCYGTTMYLKSKYGKGFRLIIAHNGHVNSASLTDDLEQFIPVTFIGITATEVVYSIDMQYTKSPRIVDLFHYLETSVQDSNILSFGISEATMEQVFLNVAVGDAPESGDQVEQEEEQLKMGGFNGNSLDIRSGPGLLAMQWWATWVKRANISVRQPIGFFFQVFSPILMGALLIVLLRLIKTQADSSVSLKNSTNTNEQLMDMNIIGYSKKLLIFTGTRYSWIQKSLLADGLGAKCASRDRCSATSASFPSNDLDYDTSKLYCTCEGCPYTSPNPAATVILPSGESLLSLSPAWASQDRIDAYLLGVNHPGLTGLIQEIGGDVTIWTGVQVNPWLRATDVAQLPMRALLYNALSNARLRNFTGSNEFSITFYAEDQYIVRDDGLVTSQRRQYGIDGILKELVVVLISAVSLAVPFFNVLIVLLPEQNNGSKQLQHLMGMSRTVFWLANFVWDMGLFVISISVLSLMFVATKTTSVPCNSTMPADATSATSMDHFMISVCEAFTPIANLMSQTLPDVDMNNFDTAFYFLTVLVYGLAMTYLIYVMSFFFNRALYAILVVYIVSQLMIFLAIVLQLLSMTVEEKDSLEIKRVIVDVVNAISYILPPYFLTGALTVSFINQLNGGSRWTWNVLGARYATIFSAVAGLIILLILLETRFFARLFKLFKFRLMENLIIPQEQLDEDVARVQNEICMQTAPKEEQAMTVKMMSKVYSSIFKGKKQAVRGVTFAVDKGTCFGLAGINGAGKSSLFKMLTGYEQPTGGGALVLDKNIFKFGAKTAKHMSYCPQDNVLFDGLTPMTHLHFYGRIRGIPKRQRNKIIDHLILRLGLTPHKNKQARALSGGNKRKLNLAIALMTYPDVIFLDEVSTGMDPKARRAAWTCIEDALKQGCSSVLTSHSMEECEALCNNLVVMVNGQFQCIGGVQYLKDKFGNNYNVKLRLSPNTDPQEICRKILAQYSGMTIIEQRACYLEVQIPSFSLKLSDLFALIHQIKEEFHIVAFSVAQTTLDHVFVNMVKQQN